MKKYQFRFDNIDQNFKLKEANHIMGVFDN